MNKIVIINNWLISGGAEKQGLILAKTLNNFFKVYLCIYYTHKIEDKFLKEVESNNIELVLLEGTHFNKLFSFYSFCKREKVSMIISYLFVGNVLNAIVGSILKIKHRIGGIRSSKHPVMKNLIQRYLHNHHLTLTVSNNYKGKDECSRLGYDPKKIIVISNCFEFKSVTYNTRENTLIEIITVARFVDPKDFLTSIKAINYAISNSEKKNIHYTILGYGELENQIRWWINEFLLSDFISIVLNPENVYQHLVQSDIYLSTSLVEGMSNSIMEGMSFSLPIVATNVGDNCILVKDEFNGYLTQPGDYIKLGKHLLDLVNNGAMRKEMGKNSYIYLRENFSIEKFTDNYLSVINKLFAEEK